MGKNQAEVLSGRSPSRDLPCSPGGVSVTQQASGESEALDRLEADDVALEKVLEDARSAAGRAVAAARAAAGADAAVARRRLEAEVAALREGASRDVAAIDQESRTRAAARAAELRERAGRRVEAAVARVLQVVCGEEP
jgi:hypothetical protein